MLKYISTRGQAPRLGFSHVTLTGLALDGGLYIPERFPLLLEKDIQDMAQKTYVEAAWQIMLPFVGDDIYPTDLVKILNASYSAFDTSDVVPLHQLEDGLYIQEMFHGPTLAFKDIAMQFLGHMFDTILDKRQQRVTIVGATSGDTGSAAIEAFKNKDTADIFILHPKGKVSEVQRRQMTTVDAPNVFNIAIDGNFDDCQGIVKELFQDHEFRQEINLSAVNSINWTRILAQTVYYVYTAARLYAKTGKLITFCVPTGNFGNVYAGYVARMMGAPIQKLIVATNSNDILHRFLTTGRMQIEDVQTTLSPSMDIQVSSNFERLAFDLLERDGSRVNALLTRFRETGELQLGPEIQERVSGIFKSGRQSDQETLEVIRRIYETYDYMCDPHTAVGVGVAQSYQESVRDSVVVSLATAHPAKFPDVIKKATGINLSVPSRLSGIYEAKEKMSSLPAKVKAVQEFIRDNRRS